MLATQGIDKHVAHQATLELAVEAKLEGQTAFVRRWSEGITPNKAGTSGRTIKNPIAIFPRCYPSCYPKLFCVRETALSN